VSLGCRQCGCGRSVDSGVELQEWLFRLCRKKALHWASQNGHTETAMALVEAGADVHCNGTERVRVLGLFRGFGECAPQWREGLGARAGAREGNWGDSWEEMAETCGRFMKLAGRWTLRTVCAFLSAGSRRWILHCGMEARKTWMGC
jgi:hypothetical protein